jgi:hypothetical protein
MYWRMPIHACLLAAATILSSQSLHALDLTPADSPVHASLRGTLDAEMYVADSPAPGLLFSDDETFFHPRATLFLDVHVGNHVFASVQARFDRGFDPGAEEDGDARLDEYFVRWTPLDSPVVNIQAGKFATVFGNWVPRHLSWDNPFINAPVPYENVIGITDLAAPQTRAAFLNRKNLADKKREWLVPIWGPSYAHGASVFGRIEEFDYAFEVKSAALSSRPAAWEAGDTEFDEPSFTGRVGWRPNASWNMGTSFSTGAYMQPDRDLMLPRGTDRGDFTQDTIGFDVSYARHRFELWGELILSRFEVPRVGDADTLSYFLEAKYKLTESLFLAARWNQQFFEDVGDGRGGSTSWDRDLYRADFAVGYRFNRNLQTKLQYSFGHEGGENANADHLLAAQVTVRF